MHVLPPLAASKAMTAVRPHRVLAGFALSAASALIGCNREGGSSQGPVSRPVVTAGTVAVSGKVTFDGPPPPPGTLGEQLCCDKKVAIPDESLVVEAGGGVRNVVVYLKDGPNVASPPPPAVLDQAGCRYVPHVLAVRAGQPVTVKSSDPTLHNAHADKGTNKPFNLPFADAGDAKTVTFPSPEVAVRVRCDVHQWMGAYVAVFDHPYYAVTGEGGRFELPNVPAGTYTLVAWHER
ncbi:MAG: hypothetical protein JWO31_2532, partial [Phycisphaerales bacterium]|nr:hypothetical protein [Phycisphaerales bacterium]